MMVGHYCLQSYTNFNAQTQLITVSMMSIPYHTIMHPLHNIKFHLQPKTMHFAHASEVEYTFQVIKSKDYSYGQDNHALELCLNLQNTHSNDTLFNNTIPPYITEQFFQQVIRMSVQAMSCKRLENKLRQYMKKIVDLIL